MDLNGDQFHQGVLFPDNHPAMRERGPAEFTPEEFREKPGAWFHGTYKAAMPTFGTSEAAGVHLGTRRAAEERVDHMGARHPQFSPGPDPDAPASIHVRRLTQVGEAKMQGSPEAPNPDLETDWDTDPTGRFDSRGAHTFGEFYKNDVEDEGSISIRVPDAGTYLVSHRQAVDTAIRQGHPVHPLTRALVDRHGVDLDKPEEYHYGQHQEAKDARDPYRTEQANHDTLLPYKVSANTRIPGHPVDRDRVTGWNRPAITFAATRAEADAMTGTSRAHPYGDPAAKWKSRWRDW